MAMLNKINLCIRSWPPNTLSDVTGMIECPSGFKIYFLMSDKIF